MGGSDSVEPIGGTALAWMELEPTCFWIAITPPRDTTYRIRHPHLLDDPGPNLKQQPFTFIVVVVVAAADSFRGS